MAQPPGKHGRDAVCQGPWHMPVAPGTGMGGSIAQSAGSAGNGAGWGDRQTKAWAVAPDDPADGLLPRPTVLLPAPCMNRGRVRPASVSLVRKT